MRATATFRIWRGDDGAAATFKDYATAVSEGMVVLDAVHQIQAEQANDLAVRWNCKAGKCGSCSAEVNGNPRLMCMTRLNQLDLSTPVTVEPMRAFPPIRDLVTDVSWNFRVEEKHHALQAAAAGRRRRHLADGAGGRRARAGVPEVHRVLPVPGRLPRAARPSDVRRFVGPRHLVYAAALEMHPLDTDESRPRSEGRAGHRLLQHHEVLHEGVSRRTSRSPTTRSSR